MRLCLLVSLWCLPLCWGNDSLKGALEAVTRRQRDLNFLPRSLAPPPPLYYDQPYYSRADIPGDGQPEDIGYGYQKSIGQNTAGVFESVALPSFELGNHDYTDDMHTRPSSHALENILLDYIEDEVESNMQEPGHYLKSSKRSIFRERDEGNLPESLQRLYIDDEDQNEEARPVMVGSPFRERFGNEPSTLSFMKNSKTLARNFGGLNRDTDIRDDEGDNDDQYLTILNSIWQKYRGRSPDEIDPEEISESEAEEILEYLNEKQNTKRQYGVSYNSPMLWVKRDKQRLEGQPQSNSEEFIHALKFLSPNRETLESMRGEDGPGEEQDEDVSRVLLAEEQRNVGEKASHHHMKRLWRDGAFDERYPYKTKRFPVTKRSSGYSPAALHHMYETRSKKNVKATDPKVAQELNHIFSSPPDDKKEISNNKISTKQSEHSSTNTSQMSPSVSDVGNNNKSIDVSTVNHHMHRRDDGQQEENSDVQMHKTLQIKKKSIDWSDYFGIDRRRKKSLGNDVNDEWLLRQYLKAYSEANGKDPRINREENNGVGKEVEKKKPDEMDSKLRAMEDMIVEEALKYTGAHEGATDSREVQEVKDRVMAQLAAAYSLEKMRRALGEFKSSIAAQKATAPQIHSANLADKNEAKKRVGVKKEKAELTKQDGKLDKKAEKHEIDNEILPDRYFKQSQTLVPESSDEEIKECPVLHDIDQRCKQIGNMVGDRGEVFLPLCSLHQICYLCGPELGTSSPSVCDISFLSQASTVCHKENACRFAARRTLAAMRSLKGDPSPAGCDWQAHPCLARFLTLANTRR